MWAKWNEELQKVAAESGIANFRDLLVPEPEGEDTLEAVAKRAAAGTPAEKIAWAAARAVSESDPEDWVAFWARAYLATVLAPEDDLVDRLIFEGNSEKALAVAVGRE